MGSFFKWILSCDLDEVPIVTALRLILYSFFFFFFFFLRYRLFGALPILYIAGFKGRKMDKIIPDKKIKP